MNAWLIAAIVCLVLNAIFIGVVAEKENKKENNTDANLEN